MRNYIVIIMLLFLSLNKGSSAKNNNEDTLVIDSTLTIENVYEAIVLLDIKYPNVVISQIIIESGNLNSTLCKNNNNLLGMKVARRRKTTAINKTGYAKYNNWIESLIDYKYYQEYILTRNKIETREEYIDFLHRSYARSSDYKRIISKLTRKHALRNSHNSVHD